MNKKWTTTTNTGTEHTTSAPETNKLGKALFGRHSKSNIIQFSDGIYDESIADLIDEIEEVASFSEGKIVIYFSSNGGYVTDMIKFIDYIEQCEHSFEFVLCKDSFSAGCFIPMLLARLEKFCTGDSTIEVLPMLTFGLHVSNSAEFDLRKRRDTRNHRRVNVVDEQVRNEIDEFILSLCKEAKLTEDELNLLSLGEDLMYTSDEFCEMLSAIGQYNSEQHEILGMQEYIKEGLDSGVISLDFIFEFVDEIRKQKQDIEKAMTEIIKPKKTKKEKTKKSKSE